MTEPLVITRLGTPHGPHCFSPDGPNSATVGVPTAAAICIGAESTPMNSFAACVSAASYFSDNWPDRLNAGRCKRA